MLERVVDQVLPAFGEHHTVDLPHGVAAHQGDVLRHLREPAAEGAERPLEAAVLVHDRLLPREMPDAGVPVLEVDHPQEAPLADDDLRATAVQAAGSARGPATGRLGEHGGLGPLTEHDEHVRHVDATIADGCHHVDRIGDPHAGRHVEHGTGRMKCGVRGGEPIAIGVDHGKPVRLERGRVPGKHFIGRSKHHPPGRDGRLELRPHDMPVDRRKPARKRSGLLGLRCRFEVGIGVGGEVIREDRRREQSIGRDRSWRRCPPQSPSFWLEGPQVGPHPVFSPPLGEAKRLQSLKGGPAAGDRPFRKR